VLVTRQKQFGRRVRPTAELHDASRATTRPRKPLLQLTRHRAKDGAEAGFDGRHGSGKGEPGRGRDQPILDRGHSRLVLEKANKLDHWVLSSSRWQEASGEALKISSPV